MKDAIESSIDDKYLYLATKKKGLDDLKFLKLQCRSVSS